MDDTTPNSETQDGYGPAPAPRTGHWICWHDGWTSTDTYWTEEPCLSEADERLGNEQRRIARDMERMKAQEEN